MIALAVRINNTPARRPIGGEFQRATCISFRKRDQGLECVRGQQPGQNTSFLLVTQYDILHPNKSLKRTAIATMLTLTQKGKECGNFLTCNILGLFYIQRRLMKTP